MIQIPVHNMSGQQIDTLEVDESKLGGEVRPGLLKQAYVLCHANQRQGTAATRSRGMVSGSTRKLFRQKGTGNARRGAIRTNVQRGGGMTFAKTAKSWRQKMPHKMRRLANRNALLAKLVDSHGKPLAEPEIRLVDQFAFDKPSTKSFGKLLESLHIDRSCLLALSDTRDTTARSAANLDSVSLTHADRLTVFDLLNHRFVLMEKQAFTDWLDRASLGRASVADEADVQKMAKQAQQAESSGDVDAAVASASSDDSAGTASTGSEV